MDSDSDDLNELLRIAAEEGELNLTETKSTPNSTQKEQTADATTPSQSTNGSTQSKSDEYKPIKLAEEAYDSSDEEDLQNFFERKYNEYGRDINTMLKRTNADRRDAVIGNEVNRSIRNGTVSNGSMNPSHSTQRAMAKPIVSQQPPAKVENVYTDPIFGLRIVQPLVSSSMLRERMIGRTPVEIRYLQNHLQNADQSLDWCIAGVIVNKGAIQTSAKGSQFVVWKLTDLKADIKSVSLFLFKSAYKELWKTSLGTAIAILNPSVFSRKDNNGESSLSIDNAQRVMILGRSKDYGICKSKKKNGDPCTAVVNLTTCEFCVYHVKQEYAKLSTRSDLQSSTSGRGLQALKNKILGKSEVFYGGKSFMAEPARPSKKTSAKDQQRLLSLSSGYQSSPSAVTNGTRPNYLQSSIRSTRIAEAVESNPAQRAKDLERLKSLNVTMSTSPSTSILAPKPSTSLSSPSLSSPSLSNNHVTKVDFTIKPSLSRESFSFTLSPSGSRSNEMAKAKAAALLQKKPIAKANPNFVKYRGTEAGKKRAHEVIEETANDENAQKKRKLAEDIEKFKNERIRHILGAKSSHAELIEAHENNVQDQYFNKLEKKEAMEEKMLKTTKMECKAVICMQCKYKAFSAADRCKEERHPLKVIDAEKRFYECEDCGNRTITLFRIPKVSCSNCQGSRWKRTGMIRDKSAIQTGEPLSIRGDEEVFIGSLQSKGNINLCVAEE